MIIPEAEMIFRPVQAGKMLLCLSIVCSYWDLIISVIPRKGESE